MIIDTTVTVDLAVVAINMVKIILVLVAVVVVGSMIAGFFYDREMRKAHDRQRKIDEEIDRLHK